MPSEASDCESPLASLEAEAGDEPSLTLDLVVQDTRWYRQLGAESVLQQWAAGVVLLVLGGEPDAPKTLMDIALVLTNDEEIAQLNAEFRQKEKPTNVLSFPSGELESLDKGSKESGFSKESLALGDVIISLDTLKREAEEQAKTLTNHATHMLMHGVLHLLGYDHIKPEEATVMEAKEISLLQRMGIENPYGD